MLRFSRGVEKSETVKGEHSIHPSTPICDGMKTVCMQQATIRWNRLEVKNSSIARVPEPNVCQGSELTLPSEYVSHNG
jgi:hypothetical protein